MRIGIVTLCARRGRKRENLDKIVRFGEQAAERGCRLVAFPEYSVNGPWLTYDPEARFEDLRMDAEPIPGPATELLRDHARRLGIAFCAGLAERGLLATPFNTQVTVDAGGVLHKQSKLGPTVSEVAFYRGGGDDVKPFTLEGRCFGVTICADNGSDALHDRLYREGARIFLAPHAGAIKKYEEPGGSWEELLAWHRERRLKRYPEIARRLGVTVVYFDAVDPRDRFEDLPEWVHYVSGKSAVFGPDGACLAENRGNEESLITLEV
jgi:predicted amidohydrolase